MLCCRLIVVLCSLNTPLERLIESIVCQINISHFALLLGVLARSVSLRSPSRLHRCIWRVEYFRFDYQLAAGG